jgi:hypothetical protein
MALLFAVAHKCSSLVGIVLGIGLLSCSGAAAIPKSEAFPVNRTAPIKVSEAFGVNYSFPNPNLKAEELDLLAATGVRWVRMDMGWAQVERIKGQYDFTAYDSIFNAFSKYKFRLLVILTSNGQTNYPNKAGQFPYPPDTPEAQQAFTNWVRAVIQRYKGRGIAWEMYNEPNNRHFWPPQPNAQDYSRLAIMVGSAFKEIAPQEIHIGPALATSDYKYLEEVFKAGLLSYWTAVSVHPYRSFQGPETVSTEYQQIQQMIRKYNSSKASIPILSGEWGYPSVYWEGVSFDEWQQAKLLARQWLVNVQNRIPISIWFSWCDGDCLTGKSIDEYDYFGLIRTMASRSRSPQKNIAKRRSLTSPVLKNRFSRKGVVYRPLARASDLHPKRFPLHRSLRSSTTYDLKPAYFAARTLTTIFRNYTFDRQLKVVEPDVYLLRFKPPRKNKQPGFAVWSSNNQPRAITLPLPSGNYQVTSHLGDDLGTINSQGRLAIEVTDSPLYLVKK